MRSILCDIDTLIFTCEVPPSLREAARLAGGWRILRVGCGRLAGWLSELACTSQPVAQEDRLALPAGNFAADALRVLITTVHDMQEIFVIREEKLEFHPDFPRDERAEMIRHFTKRVKAGTRYSEI